MDDSGLTDLLQSFGLTKKEADTYTTILQHGETTAKEVSQEAGVSKRHVYNTAERLETHGLVEMVDFVTPTLLRPTPPDRVKERYRSNIDHLHEQLADQYNGAKADLETVQVIKSGPSLKKRIQKFIDEADQIISIIVPPVLLAELTDALAAAVDRDVFVLLVTYGNLKEQLAVDAFDLDEIAHVTRTQQTEVPIQLAVDGSFGLLAPRSLLTNPSEQTKAVAFGQSYIEPVVYGNFLSNEWKFAEETNVRQPNSLPKTYSCFQYAVMEAAVHATNGESLFATVEARSTTDTTTQKQFSGQITDIRQQLVEPTKGAVIECALDIETADGVVSIGGKGAFKEEYEAILTRLEIDKR
ncbi:TrmB family transcriptional regulator [Natronolimnobius sp. AArcel1]|uniref:TrmB family transcriptional regulator sugar-binding domain-containing protein n=1 Tax=Natronolimnobius sp. AArcel1 TaxID=1679093 RepID=UPI0013EB7155|nr:TrmB family transcriptional regulator sugar-binding domain-containing protein [Natronolimnobius sp. AArcel1]NGM70565.1 TrmB family transcriptional regulator [Natronolimnobius sp. AArcel1]